MPEKSHVEYTSVERTFSLKDGHDIMNLYDIPVKCTEATHMTIYMWSSAHAFFNYIYSFEINRTPPVCLWSYYCSFFLPHILKFSLVKKMPH